MLPLLNEWLIHQDQGKLPSSHGYIYWRLQTMLNHLKASLFIVIVGLLTSCSRSHSIYSPSFGPLTDEIISNIKPSNPMIIVPGIGGTRLVDAGNGETAWGSYGYNTFWPSTEKDNKLLSLPLSTIEQSLNINYNKVIPKSVIDSVKIDLIPFSSIELSVYATIVKSLKDAGYFSEKIESLSNRNALTQETPMFQFAYDWRQSNAQSAKALEKFIEKKSEQLDRQKLSSKNQKFDIVCHSMGCLVARYYLRYGSQGLGTDANPPQLDWRGSHKVENIIMIAPPNKGSIEAFSNMINGFRLNHIQFLKYPAAVLGTMPSMYELLPREDISQATNHEGKAIDLLDPKLWQSMNWGLLDPGQEKILNQIAPQNITSNEKYLQAKELQAKLLGQARLFHSRLDQEVSPPKGLHFWLFAGSGKPTESNLTIHTKDKTWTTQRVKAGDGAVLRPSAYAIKNAKVPKDGSIIPWDNAIFFFSSHMDLVKNNDFFVNLYDILLWRSAL